MSLDLPGQSRSLVPSSPFPSDDLRPSHESQQPILRPTPIARSFDRNNPVRPSVEGPQGLAEQDPSSNAYEQYREEPPRNRHMTRWAPSNEWDYDQRADRRYNGERSSFDQGPMRRDTEYYEDSYYGRPYRRRPSVRQPPSRAGSRLAPPPRHPGRKMPDFEETYEDEETEAENEKPRRARKRRTSFGSDDGSTTPEVIYRLPYLDWMNSSLKNRKHHPRPPKCNRQD